MAGLLAVLCLATAQAASPPTVNAEQMDMDADILAKIGKEKSKKSSIADGIKDQDKAFTVVGIRASDRAHREPHLYDRMRDELLANLANWLIDGGAIPEDTKLAAELHAPEWTQTITGRLKATPKDEIRKKLGRSPDRGDAVALAVWEPSGIAARVAETRTSPAPPPALDPYSGLSIWQSGG